MAQNTPNNKLDSYIAGKLNAIKVWGNFLIEYNDSDNICFRKAVNNYYLDIKDEESDNLIENAADGVVSFKDKVLNEGKFNENKRYEFAAARVFSTNLPLASSFLENCIR